MRESGLSGIGMEQLRSMETTNIFAGFQTSCLLRVTWRKMSCCYFILILFFDAQIVDLLKLFFLPPENPWRISQLYTFLLIL